VSVVKPKSQQSRSPRARRSARGIRAANSELRLQFLGAAGTVTGSKYLIEVDGVRVLVDCGLYQGLKPLRLRNWAPFAVDPKSLDAVVLTHAHIDHSGFLPGLVRDGYAGPIYCTPWTAELCEIVLPDAGMLQEEDASYANRKGFSKHSPALPLYTRADAERALQQLSPIALDRPQTLPGGLAFRFASAGHILGAASAEISSEAGRLLFSGDLGRSDDLLMQPPARPGSPDWVVVESTYGDRDHPGGDPFELLAGILRRTLERGGILLVPAFAVGRAQTLLYCLHEVFRRGLAPRVPVYVNSPMATDVTELFRRALGAHKLAADECEAVCGSAHFTRSVEESKQLVASREPAVILSASGMASGGRVLHHLKSLAPSARNTILLPGFQAPGTRGDSLARGQKQVKIHGSYVEIAAEVIQLDVFSAHADQSDLLAWLAACERPPRRVFVTHGEGVPADTLRRLANDRLKLDARVPEHGESVTLG
jgi:metallo-beta-lactamase family protein